MVRGAAGPRRAAAGLGIIVPRLAGARGRVHCAALQAGQPCEGGCPGQRLAAGGAGVRGRRRAAGCRAAGGAAAGRSGGKGRVGGGRKRAGKGGCGVGRGRGRSHRAAVGRVGAGHVKGAGAGLHGVGRLKRAAAAGGRCERRRLWWRRRRRALGLRRGALQPLRVACSARREEEGSAFGGGYCPSAGEVALPSPGSRKPGALWPPPHFRRGCLRLSEGQDRPQARGQGGPPHLAGTRWRAPPGLPAAQAACLRTLCRRPLAGRAPNTLGCRSGLKERRRRLRGAWNGCRSAMGARWRVVGRVCGRRAAGPGWVMPRPQRAAAGRRHSVTTHFGSLALVGRDRGPERLSPHSGLCMLQELPTSRGRLQSAAAAGTPTDGYAHRPGAAPKDGRPAPSASVQRQTGFHTVMLVRV